MEMKSKPEVLCPDSLEKLESEASLMSQPTTPTMKSALASPIYQTHLEAESTDTLSSANLSEDDDEHAHTEDHDHVTQVHRIAARQSVIARSIGNAIPRRLSRARSRPILAEGDTSNNMVIGVSVQAATVEVESSGNDEQPVGAVVHGPASLKNQKSKSSLGSTGASSGGSVGGGGWIARAKSLTIKLRRKSRVQLTEIAT
ncbi:hypothetical protein AAF712_000303 [Marasmius tenuissimus]|uniref:Uncharacterized protein n=1 Tax=Marasmius tenuissimus TaxID=585030 RepID=A0ABR3AF43_9AGAR